MDSDGGLLRRFVENGDESAFFALVNSHAGLVHGVALRCCRGDVALSAEVTQSVFFLLARRALSVPVDELSRWLHRVAVFTSCNAWRKFVPERGHYHDDPQGETIRLTSLTEAAAYLRRPRWEDIRLNVDEAMLRLRRRDHRAVMLRFFENRTLTEIAEVTQSNEETVCKILKRSVRRLREFFAKRKIFISDLALEEMLSAQSFLAPPAATAALAAGAFFASTAVAIAAGPSPLLLNPSNFLLSAHTLKIAALALTLVLVPVVWLWRENNALRQEVQALREIAPSSEGGEQKPLLNIVSP